MSDTDRSPYTVIVTGMSPFQTNVKVTLLLYYRRHNARGEKNKDRSIMKAVHRILLLPVRGWTYGSPLT